MAEQQQLPIPEPTSPLDQIKQFYSRLSRQQRILIGGVTAIAVLVLGFVFFTPAKPPMAVLFSELDEKDAATIIEKLKERKQDYELSDKGTTIMVRQNEVYDTRIALASEGIPQSSTVGYELFDKSNLGMSDFMQKLNYRRALEGELARTIGKLEEVEKARVHITVPEKALFEKDKKKPTASVVLKLKSSRRVSKMNIEGVQHLVASSIEGMEPSAVTVIDQRGQVLSEAQKDQNSLAGMSSTQYEQKARVDEYMTSKIQSLLDGVLGPGKSVARVNAELDFSQNERVIEDFDPDRQVVLSEETTNEANASLGDSLNFPAVNAEAKRGKTVTNYQNSKTTQKIVSEVGAIKRITASVLVDGVYKSVDGQQAPQYNPRNEQEMEQLRQIIRNSVGYDPGRNDQISVVNVPFDTNIEEAPPKEVLGMPIADIIEKIIIVLIMGLIVYLVRKLIASQQVRSRIEAIFAPSELEKRRIEIAQAATTRQQELLKNIDEKELATLTAPIQLEAPPQFLDSMLLPIEQEQFEEEEPIPEMTPEELLASERRVRVVEYMNAQPDEAVRLFRSLLKNATEQDMATVMASTKKKKK